MLQETLKLATKQNHDELEELMHVGNIMSGSLSVDQYTEILTTNYHVHKTFEHDLYANLNGDLAQQLDLDHREKLEALEADIKELQLDPPVMDNAGIHFNNDAERLGALYVLEGATLGGSVIVKKLKTNTNFAGTGLGFHYYQVYGSELINKWKSFCEVLNRQPESTFNSSVAGAQKMFDAIANTQRKVSAV